jgi:hypothetical protein
MAVSFDALSLLVLMTGEDAPAQRPASVAAYPDESHSESLVVHSSRMTVFDEAQSPGVTFLLEANKDMFKSTMSRPGSPGLT